MESINNEIWCHTASGNAFYLLNPKSSQIDFINDIAPQLSRQTRFNGATKSILYSIAQHCVIGADVIFKETRDPVAATHFLVHDAHEAFLGDLTTPVAKALSELGRQMGIGSLGNDISHVISTLKNKIDNAIYEAAGINGPSKEMKIIIKNMDLRMIATEKRDLLNKSKLPWTADIENTNPINGITISPWKADYASAQWIERLKRYCPIAIM